MGKQSTADILAAAAEAIKLGLSIFEAYNNGDDQAELEKRWNANVPKVLAAEAAWKAATRT